MKTKEFNREEAESYLNNLIKQYNIKVVERSKSSCGWARWDTNEIKIPHPTNIDRFGVCLHEISHIIDADTKNGKPTKRYEQEFYCDMYARNILIEFGYDTTEWDQRTRWHILSRIEMATNRGVKKVNEEIVEYFNDVDFDQWYGKKVWVGAQKDFSNVTIDINNKN